MGLIKAEQLDIGNGPNQIVALDDQGRLPAVDASQLDLPFPYAGDIKFKGVLVSDPVDSIPTGASETVISWNNEVSDSHNTFSLGAPTRLTVPVNSWAQVTARVVFSSDVVGERRVRIMRNGIEFIGNADVTIDPRASGAAEILIMTPFIPVTLNDYFELRVSQTSGNMLTLDASSYFGMTVIG